MTPSRTAAGFGTTSFLSALLLFQIQPLISKHILPWYGGSPAVWTSCLLFFQSILFAGYAYAHWLTRRVTGRRQALIHGGLIVAAVVPAILPGPQWAPTGEAWPVPGILAMLTATVGLPYFVLSATTPLIQTWAHRIAPGWPPWKLFATSNAGSLAALASYPFLVEPNLTVFRQAIVWKWGFVAFGALCATILWRMAAAAPSAPPGGEATADGTAGPAPATQRPVFWIGWSCTGVVLFMAVTNQLSLSIAAVPFLWVMPLGVYLSTFVIMFRGPRWYPRRVFAGLLVVAVAAIYAALARDLDLQPKVLDLGSAARILIAVLALFVCCAVCHGELYRSRPPASRLTRFYLAVSLGGVMGGILVGVVAPLWFLLYHELQLGLVGLGVLYLVAMRRDPLAAGWIFRAWPATAAVLIAVAGMVAISATLSARQLEGTVFAKRNFFGLIRVREGRDAAGKVEYVELGHGSILHGLQASGARRVPTMYYGRISGVGLAMQSVQRPGGRQVGVLGMGAATLAAYGARGDRFRFYEIDPDVVDVARRYFSFLDDSAAECDVAVGDGRLSLEREESQDFDVFVVDAFSGDAIPIHLLTVEAMAVYDRHLKQDGVLAFHITNHYLDLAPVVARAAASRGFRVLEVRNLDEPGGATRASTWMILSRSAEFFQRFSVVSQPPQQERLVGIREGVPAGDRGRVWTDSYSNLIGALR